MNAKQWIKEAQGNGWRVQDVKDRQITMCCTKYGCEGAMRLPMDNLGLIPDPCALQHEGRYSFKTFKRYENLVGQFRSRRRSLGLSQEDITAASGLADGHINKLEAFARTAEMPTLQLWAETLGLKLTVEPCSLPPKTLQVIEGRLTDPYREEMVRDKPVQRLLFHE